MLNLTFFAVFGTRKAIFLNPPCGHVPEGAKGGACGEIWAIALVLAEAVKASNARLWRIFCWMLVVARKKGVIAQTASY